MSNASSRTSCRADDCDQLPKKKATRAHVGYGLDKPDPEKDIHLTLLEAAPRILPQLGEKIARAATELLSGVDVSVR